MTRDFAGFLAALDNAGKARRAVARWADIEPAYKAEDFISGDILSFGGLLRVAIHSNVPGGAWTDAWRRSEPGEFQGIPTHFAGLEDVIAMKEAAGRPEKDLPDLKHPRRLLHKRKGD